MGSGVLGSAPKAERILLDDLRLSGYSNGVSVDLSDALMEA